MNCNPGQLKVNKSTRSIKEIKQSVKKETEKALKHWESLTKKERQSIDKETTIGTPENLVVPDEGEEKRADKD